MSDILFIYSLGTLIFSLNINFSLYYYDYLCFLFSCSLVKHLKIDNPMIILFPFSLLNVFQGSLDKQIPPIQSLFQLRKAQIFNKYVFYLLFYSQKLKMNLNSNSIYLFCKVCTNELLINLEENLRCFCGRITIIEGSS